MPNHMNTKLIRERERSTFCCIVLEEDLDDIDMLRPREWIATDSNTQRLSEPYVGCLGDSLVCQCTRPGHDPYIEDIAAVNVMTWQGRTDFPRLVDVSGLNTHLAPEWVDDSRAIRANETRL